MPAECNLSTGIWWSRPYLATSLSVSACVGLITPGFKQKGWLNMLFECKGCDFQILFITWRIWIINNQWDRAVLIKRDAFLWICCLLLSLHDEHTGVILLLRWNDTTCHTSLASSACCAKWTDCYSNSYDSQFNKCTTQSLITEWD